MNSAKTTCDVSVEAIPAQIAAANRNRDNYKTIHIFDIKPETCENEIKFFFKHCGIISNVEILLWRNGQPKGEAYIEFISAKSVLSALKKSGTLMDGKKIKVERKASYSDENGEYSSGFRNRFVSVRPGSPVIACGNKSIPLNIPRNL